jgi:hypothetical protein
LCRNILLLAMLLVAPIACGGCASSVSAVDNASQAHEIYRRRAGLGASPYITATTNTETTCAISANHVLFCHIVSQA